MLQHGRPGKKDNVSRFDRGTKFLSSPAIILFLNPIFPWFAFVLVRIFIWWKIKGQQNTVVFQNKDFPLCTMKREIGENEKINFTLDHYFLSLKTRYQKHEWARSTLPHRTNLWKPLNDLAPHFSGKVELFYKISRFSSRNKSWAEEL